MPHNLIFRRPPLSAYNITESGDEATINLYGEIVETAPLRWDTGEPIEDGYIALNDVLPQIEALASKSRVTVHINSLGGDLFSGLAIYNRLKSLPGEVVTVCDSIAASAGSIIFQAGDVRQIYASSAVMAHHALSCVWGMYNAADMRDMAQTLDTFDRQLVSAYVERTGLDEATVLERMDAESWMVGQDAVDAGFADEVIAGQAQPVTQSDAPGVLNVGRLRVAARMMPFDLPTPRARDEPAQAAPENKIKEKGSNPMIRKPKVRNEVPEEDKPAGTEEEERVDATEQEQEPAAEEEQKEPTAEEITTVEELRQAYPDLVEQIEQAAREQGAEDENARLAEIEEIESEVDDPDETAKAKYGANSERCDASALLLRAAKARAGRTSVRARMARETAPAARVRAAAPHNDGQSADERAAMQAMLSAVAKLNGERK